MRRILISALMIGAMPFSACGTSDPGVSVDEVTGVWRWGGLTFFELNEDGTFRAALTETFVNSVVDGGTYSLEQGVLAFVSDATSASCGAGESGSYEVELLDPGPRGEDRLNLVQINEECQKRGAHGDFVLVRETP